jgi:hypothetical protein
MRRIAVGARLLSTASLLVGPVWLVAAMALPVAAQSAGTTVGLTVCVASSTITISSPTNDSVVNTSPVDISGTVTQANQVEVYVDDVLDHIIPLSMGQTSYSGSVGLAQGTHTVKVVAINACSGADGSASSVVTYTPPSPPSSGGSTGKTTPTTVAGESPVDTSQTVQETPPTTIDALPALITTPFTSVLQWLNITTTDAASGHGLTLWRAAVITGGLYLLVVGMAAVIVQMTASLPFVATIIPTASPPTRAKWVSVTFRILGLLMILGALLL